MKPTRRSFLASAGTLLAAAASTPLHAIVPPHAHTPPTPVPNPNGWLYGRPQVEYTTQFQWTEETFLPFVNTNFQVNDGSGGRMLLKLLAVDDLRKQTKSSTAFALRFQVIGGKGLGQGTYEFYNPQLGKFLLFVVAANKSKSAPYVAIINRL